MNVKQTSGLKYDKNKYIEVSDNIVVEEGLQISLNGTLFTITMRTPGDDQAYVRGLLHCEGIVTNNDCEMAFDKGDGTIFACDHFINVTIDENDIAKDVLPMRNIVSSSSCGLCGKIKDEEASDFSVKPKLVPSQLFACESLGPLSSCFENTQTLFKKSGGAHGAAAFTIDGRLLASAEDIGRHNAVDKVVGRLILEKNIATAEMLLVSGRVSYEIIQKAYTAGLVYVVAVSAPSSLAIELASARGMTLIGFCRNGRCTIYSNPHHINQGAAAISVTEC